MRNLNDNAEQMEDYNEEYRGSKRETAFPVVFSLGLVGLGLYCLWVASQWLLALYTQHPTWRDQLLSYAVLLLVLMVGTAGCAAVLSDKR